MIRRTAQQIADWYLAWADALDAELDNLKLQKLLYYTQGHALREFGEPIFVDELQAWAHGPVVPSVYRRFKHAGSSSIEVDSTLPSTFSWDDYRDVESFLQRVWNSYAKYASWTLREMTHREPPWLEHFSENERDAVIPVEALRAHFTHDRAKQ